MSAYFTTTPGTLFPDEPQMSLRAILYRLRARFDVREIAEQEVRAAGWDRSDYAAV